MRKIAAVYLPIAILASALVFGGLKLANEAFAQSAEPSFVDGWLVSSFTSIAFEDGLWDQPGVDVEGCTLYSLLPEEDASASVTVFNDSNPITRSYAGTGAIVKVCNLIYLPPTSDGVSFIRRDDE